jgi:predicted RNA-binding Zn-ribbon protein involved in translation (DUF1610 family)
MQQKQKKCRKCGLVLATTSDPMTFSETLGIGMVCALTCGLGMVFAIPYAVYRAQLAKTYRCPTCGAKV